MGSTKEKTSAWVKRKKRIRKKVAGTPARPRLTVFRSARHIYAQIIDDTVGRTLVAASSMEKEVIDSLAAAAAAKAEAEAAATAAAEAEAAAGDGADAEGAEDKKKKKKKAKKIKAVTKKMATAGQVGKTLAERAKSKGIGKVVFDRNGFIYHGRVKAVSEGARKAGLEF